MSFYWHLCLIIITDVIRVAIWRRHKKYIYQAIKQKEQSDKTITLNKETHITGQHEPLWKPEVKSGAPEG